MPVKVAPGSEPIPGYKLIERLGGGGFGEVWKAEAPGGLLKAMKFVYGELSNLSALNEDENSRANQEKTSLERIKKVRHSYILSVERIDEIEDQLVITTELADRTTWDRFRECRQQGLPGIPREELLNYLDETAEALDFMLEEHHLQHLDVKPQNLFLVAKHIKVADFGLVKVLGNRGAASITGGVTPVYAAPETFDGWLSRYSDQYSLAVVYQELLTGQRPFTGSTMQQLVLQVVKYPPDLGPLPSQDKAIIGRALSKNPDDRFPTCLDLIRALRASASFSGFAAPKPSPAPLTDVKPAAETPFEDGDEASRDVRTTPAKRRDWLPSGDILPEEQPAESPADLAEETSPHARDDSTPTGSQLVTGMMRMARGIRSERETPKKAQNVGDGILQPALVIGLGTLGLEALQEFRRTLNEEVGTAEQLPVIRLLGIDTDVEAIQRVCHGEVDGNLQGQETVLAKLHRPGHYLKPREGKLSSESWLNPKVLYRLPRHLNSACARPLGRLAFTDNVRVIHRKLEQELAQCADSSALAAQLAGGPLGVRTSTPRVYIVACLAGNTGGGMFLDVAYLVRHLLRKQGIPHADVIGVFLVPPVKSGAGGAVSQDLANTYAALKELTYYSTGQAPYCAALDHPDATQPAQVFREASPPLQRTYLLPLPEASGSGASRRKSLILAAQFLYRELASPLGKATDALRLGNLDPSQPIGRCSFQAFGIYRIYWPRRRLLAQAAAGFCKRLTSRWMDKKSSIPIPALASLAQQKWDDKGLRPEALIVHHQEACERVLKQAPEKMLIAALGSLAEDLAPRGGEVTLNVGQIVQTMDALEKLLGIPEECRPPGGSPNEPGHIEKTLSQVAAKISDMGEQKIAEFVVSLIEEPAHRLAGAEESLRQLSGIVERALQAQEQLCKELQERSASLYSRIQAILDKPVSAPQQTSSVWRISFSRKGVPTQPSQALELLELLKSYPKCRYQSLILQQINRLYISLRGQVSDQIREVGFCRHRLSELALMFKAPRSEQKDQKSSSHEKALLPGGVSNLDEAVRQCLDSITSDDLLALDKEIQDLIQNDFRALVQICMGPGHVLRTLAPAMLRRAETFLGAKLKSQSVTEMFLERTDDVDEELASAFDRATPAVTGSTGKNELCLIVVPAESTNNKMNALLRETLPQVERVLSARDDEIVFYREAPDLPASAVEQLGPVAQDAYRQRLAHDPFSMHTREDIADWRSSAPLS